MFEAYAFLAVFTIQILALSVLYPARSRAQDRPHREVQRLFMHRLRRVRVVQLRARAGGFAALGAVRSECLFFVIIALLSQMGMAAPPRSPEGDGLSFGR